jgi:hypothetical protein
MVIFTLISISKVPIFSFIALMAAASFYRFSANKGYSVQQERIMTEKRH